MKIQPVNSYNNSQQISHKRGIKSLNAFNPISRYLDKYFSKAAKASSHKFERISPGLTDRVNMIWLKDFSILDINPSNSKDYIFFLHGMAQNVTNYQHLYETAVKKNKGIFAVEYCGYGTNQSGKISEESIKKNIKDAYNYLINNERIKPENITVAGHSMGGALASDFASKHKDIKSLILISPIVSTDYLGDKFSMHKTLGIGIPPFVKKLTEIIKPLKWLYRLNFNSLTKVKKISVPTYIIQSRNDTVTTIKGARKLAKMAKKKGILQDFVSLPYGGHKVDAEKVKAFSEILDKIYK